MNEDHGNRKQEVNWFRAIWQILIVFILVLVVVAVLFPVYTGGGHPYRTSCISNLKQIGTANQIYLADFDDRFGPHFTFDSTKEANAFVDALYPYLKNRQLFECAQNQENQKTEHTPAGPEDIGGTINYVHSLSLRASIPDYARGHRVLEYSTFAKPELAGFMRDTIQGYGTSKNGALGFQSAHSNGFAVAYLDSHVKVRDPIDIQTEL